MLQEIESQKQIFYCEQYHINCSENNVTAKDVTIS